MLRKGSRVDGREPDADLVDAIKFGDQILEVDVMVGVVVEHQLLKVPSGCIIAVNLTTPKILGGQAVLTIAIRRR